MKKIIKLVILDIQSGQNIDAYVLVLITIFVALFDIFGTPPPELVNTILLLGLAFLIGSFVSMRRSITTSVGDKVIEGISVFRIDRTKLPPLHKEFTSAKSDILIMGPELSLVLHSELQLLAAKARGGCRVRLLCMAPFTEGGVVNPNVKIQSDYCADPTLNYALIRTIIRLRAWLDSPDVIECTDNIEVRAFISPITFKCLLVDSMTKDAWIRVDPYLYKIRTEYRPNYDVRYSTDRELYETYLKTVNLIWMEALSIQSVPTRIEG